MTRLIAALEALQALSQRIARAVRRYFGMRCTWRAAWILSAR